MQLNSKILLVFGILSLLILSGCSQKEVVIPSTPVVQPVTPVPPVPPVVDNSILDENDASVSIGEII